MCILFNLLEAVMVKFVVRSKSWQSPHSHTVGKENLRCSINPSLTLKKLTPVNVDIVRKSIDSPF